MTIDPVGTAALSEVQQLDMGPSIEKNAQAAQFDHSIDVIADRALSSALEVPGQRDIAAGGQDEFLSTDGSSNYLKEPATTEKPGFDMDQLSDKLAELYSEVAVYKVAWSVAKRTGKDIETMLKGQ